MGNTLAHLGTKVVATTYSRDQEREADDVGFQYAVTAGFEPQGGVRLFEKLGSVSSANIPFLSSDPSSEERVSAMRKRVQ
jgi:predicted Zn-dependent protease